MSGTASGPTAPDGSPPASASRPGRLRLAGRVTLLATLVLVLLGTGTGTAQAEEYRYWSFWTWDGDRWVYASQGPSLLRPGDGELVGFRFMVGAENGSEGFPRGATDFAEVCGDTPAESGRKRLALSIDFGAAADAPAGETPPPPRTVCAQVPKDASAADALADTADPLRYNSQALLCAIDGYPRRGCAEPASDDGARSGSQDSATGSSGSSRSSEKAGESEESDGGPSVGLLAGASAVVLLGGAALWQANRRRRG